MARKVTSQRQAGGCRHVAVVGCLGLLVIAAIVAVWFYLKLTSQGLPPEIQARIQAEKKAGASAGAAATGTGGVIPPQTPPLKQQVQEFEKAARAGQKATRTLYIRDSELNQMIASSAKDERLADVHAYFGQGQVYVTGTANWHGRKFPLTVTAEPVIVNGGLQFGVESVKIGSFKAPGVLTDMLKKAVSESRARFTPEKMGIYVESVEIKPGVAIVKGRPVK